MKDADLKGKMLSGMVWKFGERFIAHGVSFIVSLILARILMPKDYGAVAVINIFIAIADVFLTSGLNTALIQKKDADDIDFSTVFYCNLFLSLLLYIILFFAAPFIALRYNMPVLKNAVRVFALRLPITSFQTIQTAFVSRRLDFKKFFFATITGTLVSALVGITMAVNGFGVWALIAQYMTNTIIDSLFLFYTVRWYPKPVFSWERAKPMIRYSSRVLCTDLIGTASNYLGDFLVGLKYSPADLAYYTKGKQLPAIFKVNIYTTLVSVLFPGMSKINDDKKRVKALTRRSIRLLTFVIYPIMIGIAVIARPLTVFLYTEKWLPMVPFVIIVCIEAILSVPGTISLQTIKAIGRSDLMLKTEFIKKPVLLLSIIIAAQMGVLSIALTLPFNTLIEMIINGVLVKKTVDYNYLELFSDLMPAFLMSSVMGGAVYLITLIPFTSLTLEIFVSVLSGAVIYFFLSFITKNSEFAILVDFIMKRKSGNGK